MNKPPGQPAGWPGGLFIRSVSDSLRRAAHVASRLHESAIRNGYNTSSQLASQLAGCVVTISDGTFVQPRSNMCRPPQRITYTPNEQATWPASWLARWLVH